MAPAITKDSPAFIEAIARHGVDAQLVAAIITVESSWSPWAVRHEPLYSYLSEVEQNAKRSGWSPATERQLQKMSWGLMQVMGATARDLAYQDPLTQLIVPSANLEVGIRYLKTKLARYKGDTEAAIAAYNAGAARRGANGQFANQTYVDRVLTAIKRAN